MKTIGLLGGMAWPSTLLYYTGLNQAVEQKFGADHSARCLLYSFDFNSLNPTSRSAAETIKELSLGISKMHDTDVLLICSNTMHQYIDALETDLKQINLLDIRAAVASKLIAQNVDECLLIGTSQTMKRGFYSEYLENNFNIRVTVPDLADQEEINRIIFTELVNNRVSSESAEFFKSLSDRSKQQTVVLACTELRLAFETIETGKNIIDSTQAHIEAAVNFLTK